MPNNVNVNVRQTGANECRATMTTDTASGVCVCVYRQLTGGRLIDDNGLADGSHVTLLPHVEAGLTVSLTTAADGDLDLYICTTATTGNIRCCFAARLLINLLRTNRSVHD